MKIKINEKSYQASAGETILDVCKRNGIDVPTLCKHPDLSIKGNCRVCVVDVVGRGLVTSCSTEVKNGMQISTESENVKRTRNTNIELIISEHVEKCSACVYEDNCSLLDFVKKYDLKLNRFFDRKKQYPIWQFSDSIQFDASKCIDCRNCVEVCDKMQTCSFYEVQERGVETVVKPRGEAGKESQTSVDALGDDSDKFDCTYCGQCVVHCPVGAISGVSHWQAVEEVLQNRQDKIVVAQVAPSIRVSVAEEFGQEPGKISTGQLVTSIKELGFDYAFDVNLGADLTTYEEARELVEWIVSGKPRPMFTSCCPAWVKFVEFYYPEFISHLTTTRSPNVCLGQMVKTYFADFLKKDPRDIEVVSVMPCTSKKHEAGLGSHKIDLGWCIERLGLKNIEKACQSRTGLKGVEIPAIDHVLTTREYAYLLHRHKIDLPNLKASKADQPLGLYSGAGAIYGASGGVMESALRSADYFLRVLDETGSLKSVERGENYELKKKRYSKIFQSRIDFKEVRGQYGVKSAKVQVGNRQLKVAVVNELGNARGLLEDLKAGRVEYDYVEVMACPGGCVGGGGQPIPTNAALRSKRAEALYKIDKNLPIRTAHENQNLLEIYSKYFQGDLDLIEKTLHAGFEPAEKCGYKEI